ncbi:hypothetical protein Tco_1319329 [Tanacetum coccineum]
MFRNPFSSTTIGDENPIRTLGDYSKPSHESYMSTIELPVGNNMVPLRSDTIRLVQNGCSFHGLRSEDPNQHLKDFLKLVDSLDLDGENRERTRLRLFQFSLRDQANNWLECLPAGSITTWEDLTTQSLSEAWTRFKDLLQKVPHHGIDLWLQVQIFYDHVNPVTRRTIDQSAGGKLCDRNAEESWALLEDLSLYDNESWNDPRDYAKPIKAIALPQDIPSTSDCRLIELKNQVQLLMEAHLAPTQPTQVNKVTTSCEICSGPHDTQYCMEDPEQAFVEYASSRTDEAGGKWYTFKPEQNNLGDTYNPSWRSHPNLRWRQPQNSQNNFSNPPNRFQPNGSIPNRSFNNNPQSFNNQSNLEGLVSNFMASQDARLSKFEADFKQQQSEMTNKIDTVLKAITDRIAGALPSDTVKNPKLSTSLVLSARSYPNIDPQCSNHTTEFNCSAQVSQRQMPMWNSLKEVLYFFGLFSSVKGYLGGILLHRSPIYNSARLSNKLGNVTPSVFKFGYLKQLNINDASQSQQNLSKFFNVFHNFSRLTSQDKEDPSWSTSIKTRRQRRHLQHWKRLECHYIMLYLYLLGTFWNNPRDFAKPIKAIALPQDVPSTSDCRLIELENQVQRLMEAHLAPTQPTQVNKVTTSCETCSGHHDTHYCIEDPKQAFVEYASSRTDEAGGLVSNFMASQDARLSQFEADFKQQQSEMRNKIDIVLKAIIDRIVVALPSDMVKNPKLSVSLVFDSYDEKSKKNEEEEKDSLKNIHVYPSTPPDPSVSFITEKVLKFNSFFESLGLVPQSSDTEVVCIKGDDGEVMFIELIRKNDDSSEGEPEEEGSTTTEGRIKGMHVFVGNFTYIVDFMIVEDISSIIDPRLSQVVLGKPFVEISNMTHDPPEGVVRFTNGTDEVAYKMPHMIE